MRAGAGLCLPFVAGGLLAGCATTGDPPPRCEQIPIELYVEAGKMLNVNSEGQSMPVEVRVYVLSARDKIDGADFETLWQTPKEALGPSLLKDTSFTMFPGTDKITTIEAPQGAAYVAVVGLFRNIEAEQWRKVVDVRAAAERCRPGDLHVALRASLQDNRVIAQERVE